MSHRAATAESERLGHQLELANRTGRASRPKLRASRRAEVLLPLPVMYPGQSQWEKTVQQASSSPCRSTKDLLGNNAAREVIQSNNAKVLRVFSPAFPNILSTDQMLACALLRWSAVKKNNRNRDNKLLWSLVSPACNA